ncbi:MAG TPA: FtsX-like permease family protein [Burkholderiales bacterium]|nr:FtsX-like permease family protein [Burkholderiales bacterium]
MRLALRMLARDWRAGELRILALAIAIAVAGVTSVAFFTDRVWQALGREAHQLLGADAVLIADHPWRAEVRDEIARRGLARAEIVSFVSMARAGEGAQLVSVKAVSDAYPLRGRMRIAPGLNRPDAEARGIPEPGTAWLDERLMAELGVREGGAIDLGKSRLRVAAVVTVEPDRGISFVNIAPRVLMRLDDVPATGLIQPGSRATYQLLAAGEPPPVADFERWAKPRLGRGERLESLENARPETRAALDRAQQFLGLTAMLAVILSAVAIALSTRRYTERHLDGYAVMRCMGAGQARLFSLFAWEFVLLALAASVLGCALGFAGQAAIATWLSQFVSAALPAPGAWPALQGVATGLALLLGFALPPLLQLKEVPAVRVLRRETGAPRRTALAVYVLGLAAVFGLLLWQARDAKLAGYVFGGFSAAVVVFAAAGYAALRVVGRLGRAAGGVSWRYGLANLLRRPRGNTIQIVALALGLTAILLLTFVRSDLLESWRRRLPPDAPNRFVVGIQPEQKAPLAGFFRDSGLEPPELFPLVRARLVAINGRAVSAADYADERARRQVEREFNVTDMTDLPPDNTVSEGRWFTKQDLDAGAVSVEHWIAERLGIGLGDRLEFEAGGRSFSAPVTSIRKLEWDTMRPNFFFITTPKLLRDAPTTYMTGFHSGDADLTARLSRAFPNLTVIDVGSIFRQVRAMMDQVIRAVQFVFLFALVAGVLVLYAALLATQDERAQESALMRALGASRAQILGAQRAEFAVLGLLAGLLASLGATAIGWVLAERVFQFDYVWNAWIWAVGPALGLACILFNAWAGARAALGRPPIVALREAA